MGFHETTYLLSAKSNPNSRIRENGVRFWGYPRRNGGAKAITCIGVHTTESAPGTPALNVAKWQAFTAPSPSSYHALVDPRSIVRTLPDVAVAFHIVGLNTRALGLSFTTQAHVWGHDPKADRAMLERGAQVARGWVRTHSIPLRWLTSAQAKAGTRGFIRHSTADPSRRSDPGQNFPHALFFSLIRGAPPTARILGLEDPLQRGEDVRAWQRSLSTWLVKVGRESIAEDGVYGPATDAATIYFMAAAMGVGTETPRVGPVTLEAMAAALVAPIEEEDYMSPEDRAMLAEVHAMLKKGDIGGRRNVGDDLRRLRLDLRAIGRKLELPIRLEQEGDDVAEEGHGISS